MKLTNKQIKDISSIKYFIPAMFGDVEITNDDMVAFQRLSTHGEGNSSLVDNSLTGFNALKQGKKRRGLHMRMWEEAILDGTIPYSELLRNLPEDVVEFMRKEMFKGQDSNLIKVIYEETKLSS